MTVVLFRTIGGCRRSAEEQRYIWATMQIWTRLSPAQREKIRALIGRIARTPEEGRALYDVVVRGASPQAASLRTTVSVRRAYELRREFYERFDI